MITATTFVGSAGSSSKSYKFFSLRLVLVLTIQWTSVKNYVTSVFS